MMNAQRIDGCTARCRGSKFELRAGGNQSEIELRLLAQATTNRLAAKQCEQPCVESSLAHGKARSVDRRRRMRGHRGCADFGHGIIPLQYGNNTTIRPAAQTD